MTLDTYEAVLDDVLWECQGDTKDDAMQAMKAWLDKHTNGYTLKRFYLKKRFNQKDWVGYGV